MPGLGADFTNVLRKRHQEVTTKETPKSSSPAIPTLIASPATSPTSEKPKPESSDKPAWMKNLVAKRQSAFIDEKTVETALKSPEMSDDSSKIKPKASVKDRMRSFQNFENKNVKPAPVVESAINRSTGSAKPVGFGKIKDNVIKEKVEEKVEIKKVVSEAQPAKRSIDGLKNQSFMTCEEKIFKISSFFCTSAIISTFFQSVFISPPTKQVVIPLKDTHNTSSSAVNTSTDSTQSDVSHGKSDPVTIPTISPTVRASTFNGNLTLPQLSKLIQQQAQLITDLQSENKTLNKRVDDLERFLKQ